MRAPGLEAWRPARGEWDRAAAAHLFRRVGFGATPEELDAAVERGFEATVERVLAEEGPPAELVHGIEPLLGAGELEHLQAWWMSLVLDGRGRLRERVALMWHDHFATSAGKVGDVRLMHGQNVLFRERGAGDFRALLHAVSVDPAMLLWLDGDRNVAGKPNENFAREVLELFALGIGNYGERDIQEAARAFTGRGTRGRSFRFRADQHDDGVKTVLGRSGRLDGEEAIDAILAHPACARHVARRLLEEFVAPAPEAAAVEAVAARLVAEDWNVGRTIGAIARSELFFDPGSRRARIGGPVELIAITARALGARIAPREAARAATRMGQALFRPPSVKGWDGGRVWINAGTWIARHDLLSMLGTAHTEEQPGVRVDLCAVLGEPRSRRDAAARMLEALLHGAAAEPYRARVELACEACPDVDAALALAVALVVTSPEYQLV